MRTAMSIDKLRELIHSLKGRFTLSWVDDNDNMNTIEIGQSVNIHGKNLALGLLPSDKWITVEVSGGHVGDVRQSLYRFGL